MTDHSSTAFIIIIVIINIIISVAAVVVAIIIIIMDELGSHCYLIFASADYECFPKRDRSKK